MKILVVVDYNDGDYIEHVYRDISEETLTKFMPMIEAIKNFVPYPTKIGLCYSNFAVGDARRDDLYEKDVYTLYNQFSKEYIDEFIDTFLCFNYYADGYEEGFHTIVEISNVVTDEVYIKIDDYPAWIAEVNNDPSVKAYMDAHNDARQKWADLCGCTPAQAGSVPFAKMSKEAYAAYLKYANVWRMFRPDLEESDDVDND